jgi:hypothetical protein
MAICPFASQAYRYDPLFPSSGYVGGVEKGVLHSTETGNLPAYSGGSMAPHFTLQPNLKTETVRGYQHFNTDRPSRALRNLPGGVETGKDGAIQIELVGTCDPKAAKAHPDWMFWPEAPRWALDGVREFMRWIEGQHGIPRSAPTLWLPYPESYGNTRARMTSAQWSAFRGWCAHQHVPENVHGDVKLDIEYLLSLEDEMATQPMIWFARERGDRRVWVGNLLTRHYVPSPEALLGKLYQARAAGYATNVGPDNVVPEWDSLDALGELPPAVSSAAAPVDLDALAAKVADVLAARLRA